MIKIRLKEPGVLAHALNPSIWEVEAGLVYIASSKTARAVSSFDSSFEFYFDSIMNKQKNLKKLNFSISKLKIKSLQLMK